MRVFRRLPEDLVRDAAAGGLDAASKFSLSLGCSPEITLAGAVVDVSDGCCCSTDTGSAVCPTCEAFPTLSWASVEVLG